MRSDTGMGLTDVIITLDSSFRVVEKRSIVNRMYKSATQQKMIAAL